MYSLTDFSPIKDLNTLNSPSYKEERDRAQFLLDQQVAADKKAAEDAALAQAEFKRIRDAAIAEQSRREIEWSWGNGGAPGNAWNFGGDAVLYYWSKITPERFNFSADESLAKEQRWSLWLEADSYWKAAQAGDQSKRGQLLSWYDQYGRYAEKFSWSKVFGTKGAVIAGDVVNDIKNAAPVIVPIFEAVPAVIGAGFAAVGGAVLLPEIAAAVGVSEGAAEVATTLATGGSPIEAAAEVLGVNDIEVPEAITPITENLPIMIPTPPPPSIVTVAPAPKPAPIAVAPSPVKTPEALPLAGFADLNFLLIAGGVIATAYFFAKG